MYPKGFNYLSGGTSGWYPCEELKKENGKKVSQAHKDGKFNKKYKMQSEIMRNRHAQGLHTREKKIVCLETG